MAYRQVSPEFAVLGESYVTAKQVKVDTRDGLDIFFAVVDFDVNQRVFGIVRTAFSVNLRLGYEPMAYEGGC